MGKYKQIYTLAMLAALTAPQTFAQESNEEKKDDGNKVIVNGNIMSDWMLQEVDKKIGTTNTSEHLLTNTYIDLNARSKYIDAGLRFSYLEHPLPGYEDDFKGWGVPYYYVNFHVDKAELTLGHFYDQFGSGFIFRTYEERSLGIDNSMLGGRLTLKPYKGINFKALSGVQRRYWDYNSSWITGADLEVSLEQYFKGMADNNIGLTLGGSWVNKHEKDEDIMTDATHRLNLPETVNAFDFRANLHAGDFNVLAEYAWKTQDPSFDNGYIYRKGNVAMLSASWSKSGISALVQAKRSDNMGFRSLRSESGTSSTINFLPAFSMDHTYALAALYPYATNPDGEWAYQAEFGYKFKRGTWLGGKYGTGVKVNFSYINSIDQSPINGGGKGTDGYGSAFWKWGKERYYQDLNIQIDKKFTRNFKLNLMYMNQFYNKTSVEGKGGMIHSDIFVAEGKYRFSNKLSLRGEVQYLTTKEDEGDWVYGLLELSLMPNWMFTISDMYNCGKTDIHYYQGYVTFNKDSHRVQLGYGRTRAGYNCSGGVCRYIPASKGFTLSYNYNF